MKNRIKTIPEESIRIYQLSSKRERERGKKKKRNVGVDEKEKDKGNDESGQVPIRI